MLSANLAGIFIFGSAAAQKGLFSPSAYDAMLAIGASTLQLDGGRRRR